MKAWIDALRGEKSAPVLVTGAVCPQCRVVHSPVDTMGDFLNYCTTHRPPKLEEKHRRQQVMGWVDANFDRLAKQYDAEMTEQLRKERESRSAYNQANTAAMANAQNQGINYGVNQANMFGLGSQYPGAE